MSNQLVSLAAQFADLGGPAGIAARLSEPSGVMLVGVALVGIVVGRFLLDRDQD
ncbi:MAG: hypothetical protein WC692_04325 [Erythrobacter sp.]